MQGQNLYLTYKKDTSKLLYWVINTSNGIHRSDPNVAESTSVTINTTGQTTVSDIVNMAKLIAIHLNPVPTSIFKLFQDVIRARSTMYATFQQFVKHTPDPEIERSNATHKYFIEALTEAFNALGGGSWDSSKGVGTEHHEADDQMFQNFFSALSINGSNNDEGESSSEEENQPSKPKVQKKRSGKGKKGKRGKKSKRKQATEPDAVPTMADVPIESYRIIEDKGGLVSEYLLAIYAVVSEWMELRAFTQDLWREVAYNGLNGAVAASLTSSAISMVNQTCNAVFADFPDHESYDTIIQTITRGNPDTALQRFSMSLYRTSTDGRQPEKFEEKFLHVKEQFWFHAYSDLMAFVDDFRKNRTGKPTKAMQVQLNDWDPNFDLQHATNEERLRWRSLYTMNWLYDLVNVFSSIVVQRNTMKGEQHIYEDVDWSTSGPWNRHRRLYGLNEFAGMITTLAMQKPNTDIRKRILPHHVFQLQCIVDSFTASKGWMLSAFRGHILTQPARKFRARRDVDLFLDRDSKLQDPRLLTSIDLLKQVLEKDAEQHEDPTRHKVNIDIIDEVQGDFIDWMGESKYMHGLKTIPPSRFSKHNTNGLWEYSPLLCAAGLVEGLVIVQRLMMHLWDKIPEPTLALHLHNMLVKKGYLQRPIGLYATLEELFQEIFFPSGIPTSNFHQALAARTTQTENHRAELLRQRQAVSKEFGNDIHRILDPKLNDFFKVKSALMMYYDAGWVPERIPDDVVTIPSMLYAVRLIQTEKIADPSTNTKRLKETDLVKRARARGKTDAELLKAASISIPNLSRYNQDFNEAAFQNIVDMNDYKTGPRRDPHRVSQDLDTEKLQGRALLDLIRVDLFADVCGRNPVSSLNYALITIHIMVLFFGIEHELAAIRHPLWVKAYENAPAHMRRRRRPALVMAAMADEDDAALKVFAKQFEQMRMGAMSCVFWGDIRDGESGLKVPKDEDEDEMPLDQCSVM